MNNELMIHIGEGNRAKITARSTRTTGAPLIIDIECGNTRTEITIFTEDQDQTDVLIAAINGVDANAMDH